MDVAKIIQSNKPVVADVIKCEVCNMEFPNQTNIEIHLKGKK